VDGAQRARRVKWPLRSLVFGSRFGADSGFLIAAFRPDSLDYGAGIVCCGHLGARKLNALLRNPHFHIFRYVLEGGAEVAR
jgi:hypothetical protein